MKNYSNLINIWIYTKKILYLSNITKMNQQEEKLPHYLFVSMYVLLYIHRNVWMYNQANMLCIMSMSWSKNKEK